MPHRCRFVGAEADNGADACLRRGQWSGQQRIDSTGGQSATRAQNGAAQVDGVPQTGLCQAVIAKSNAASAPSPRGIAASRAYVASGAGKKSAADVAIERTESGVGHRRSPYMLRRYWPPTSNNAFVICPSEQTRTASISTSNTLPLSITVRLSFASISGACRAFRA